MNTEREHPVQVDRNRLIVVDDEEEVRSALYRLLRRQPYDVVLCDGPHRALERIQDQPFGVILTDHNMPGMTGMQLLRKVKEADPVVLRIMLTAHADLEMALSAINDGEIYRFFTKPWDDTQLLIDLRLAFDRVRLEEKKGVFALVTDVALLAEPTTSHGQGRLVPLPHPCRKARGPLQVSPNGFPCSRHSPVLAFPEPVVCRVLLPA